MGLPVYVTVTPAAAERCIVGRVEVCVVRRCLRVFTCIRDYNGITTRSLSDDLNFGYYLCRKVRER